MLPRDDAYWMFHAADVYPVITSAFTGGRDPVEVLRAVAEGGARVVQLREKNMSKRELYELAVKFREITKAHFMVLIINDHADIAIAAGADGVHLGQDDVPAFATRMAFPGILIGVSAHSPAEALAAERAGVDYVNLGPIYATSTKTLSMPPLGEDIITWGASNLKKPFSVMGGIKESHIPRLVQLGARRIAMITEITMAEDVAAKTAAVSRLILESPRTAIASDAKR